MSAELSTVVHRPLCVATVYSSGVQSNLTLTSLSCPCCIRVSNFKWSEHVYVFHPRERDTRSISFFERRRRKDLILWNWNENKTRVEVCWASQVLIHTECRVIAYKYFWITHWVSAKCLLKYFFREDSVDLQRTEQNPYRSKESFHWTLVSRSCDRGGFEFWI